MRKITMFLAAAMMMLAGTTPALAQKLSVGVTGGYNGASLHTSEPQNQNFDRTSGFNIGGLVAVGLSDAFAVQLEALYSQKGAGQDDAGVSATLDVTVIEFPLLAKVTIPTRAGDRTSFHFFAGPAVAFEIGCDVSAEMGGQSRSADCDDPEVQLLRKTTDFSLMFGGGLGIGAGPGEITLDISYDLGLTNLNDDPNVADESVHTRTLMLSAGYILPLGRN
jgi:hypothetical protein